LLLFHALEIGTPRPIVSPGPRHLRVKRHAGGRLGGAGAWSPVFIAAAAGAPGSRKGRPPRFASAALSCSKPLLRVELTPLPCASSRRPCRESRSW
jgi:hypothetical protein